MIHDMIVDEYYDWLCSFVYDRSRVKYEYISFEKLLYRLHHIEFRYIHPMDENREADGKDMRWRFAQECGYPDIPDCIEGPCSVLEMMVALAVRCEETIMDDPAYGNRTGHWFWTMCHSLGLGSESDAVYNERHVDDVIEAFLNHDYEPNGKGGLFWIRNCEYDLREYEIWFQLNCYIKTIT